eukprot:1152113-Pelagomonas_calceolata.AAC.4
MFDIVECLHPERMQRALSGSPQRGHCRLVDILKRTACYLIEEGAGGSWQENKRLRKPGLAACIKEKFPN